MSPRRYAAVLATVILAIIFVSCGESTPTPEPIAFSGTGDARGEIELSQGTWNIDVQFSGNENCLVGFCRDANFKVTLESDNGSRSTVAVDKTVEDWTGTSQVKVGAASSELTPGKQILTVNASGDWMLTFRWDE